MKISRDWRLVIMRVFVGGEGELRAGRSLRSRDMEGEWRRLLRVVGGLEMSMAMVAMCAVILWLCCATVR